MDPLETVQMDKDTSFILMLGAHQRNHSIFFVTDGGLLLEDGKLYLRAVSIIPQQIKDNPFIKKGNVKLSENDIDAVFVRSDPPFDAQYLLNTWLLDHLPQRIPIINSPRGLRTVNEKIWLTRFGSLIPKTLVGRERADITNFINAQKKVVVKPTDGFGGASVFLIEQGDKNTSVILETVTHNWTRDCVVQQYLPEAQKGDKRILLLNGEILGALLRVHSETDHRNNIFSGGSVQACQISPRDKEIVNELKPHLLKLGLYFVGIDVIGNHLTEVNVTSPTCLQEMNRLYHGSLETKVIEFAEQLVGQCRN